MIFNLRQVFVFLFFFASPFVDALTGFTIFTGILNEGSLFSPSQIFRLFLTVLALYLLKFREAIFIAFLMSLFLIIELLSLSLHQNISGFFVGLVYAYKLVFIVIVFFVLNSSFRDDENLSLLEKFVKGSFIYALLLLISIVFGIDKSTYAEGTFGSKGFFASGNGLSLFLGVSSVLAFLYYLKDRRMISLIYYVTLLLGTSLVGTKGSIFFIAINLFLFFYFMKGGLILFLSSTFLTFFVFLDKIILLFSVAFDVIVLRYNNSSSFIAFLASNRDNYVREALEVFNNSGFTLLRTIFGSGVYLSFRDYQNLVLPYDTLESDLFDIFFSYGLIGIISYLCIIFFGVYVSLRKSQYILFISWSSLCAYSLIGGHMLFNAMSNIAFLILVLLIIKLPRASYEEKHRSISPA